ncbi:phosphoribosyltransferase family protein [Streptomyces sp. NPDC004732]|uniref:phosphoribosyltransferase family protein n=1 Tax=Streptomyces sp. NPDC004732 TaxID=3154290 RepID=UPI0033A38EEC
MTAAQAQRVFRHRTTYLLTSQAHQAALTLLTEAVVDAGTTAAVIGIAGGGRTPAEEIAARLDVPVCHVEARHNSSDALYTQATGTVAVSIPDGFPDALGGRILLVDDICGTGATFTAVTGALGPRLARGAHVETVALCRNVGSPVRPDWWVWDVDDWVVFPWEPRPEIAVYPLPSPERIRTP